MPEIARFYGIIIKLFFGDHPPPHFPAVYGEYNALFNIETLEIEPGGYAVFWNEEIDISEYELWIHGTNK